MEPTLEPSARARAAVAAFLRGSSSESEGESASDIELPTTARPSRLGLGATPAGNTPSNEGAAERARARLQRALQTQRERGADDNDNAGDDDDSSADESRTKAIGRGRKRRRILPRAATKMKDGLGDDGARKRAVIDTTKNDAQVVDKAPASNADIPMQTAPKAHQPAHAKAAYMARPGAARDGQVAAVPGVNGGIVRKRSKTRSRQKNLRRDKRELHQRPAHLTEETLLAGRMRPHNSAPASM